MGVHGDFKVLICIGLSEFRRLHVTKLKKKKPAEINLDLQYKGTVYHVCLIIHVCDILLL